MHVFEQRGERRVSRRQKVVLQSREIFQMCVPARPVNGGHGGIDGHEWDARLDRPPAQERRLPHDVAAVPVAQPGVFSRRSNATLTRRAVSSPYACW